MILPNKHLLPRNSLLGAGAVILSLLGQPATVSALWEVAKQRKEVHNFRRFVLALTLLHTLGAVELQDGLLVRRGQ